MSRITFIANDGTKTVLDAMPGQSVMQVAAKAGLSGIVAECGGAMMCATCHVFVPADAASLFAPPSDIEGDMLEMTAVDRTRESRLSCQLVIRADTPDFSVRLPERQV